nr:putative ribonuclease H-like domain-containing protein [Tanacetum cinerariifolium]
DVNAGDIQGDVDEISRNDDVCQGNEIRIDSCTHAVNAASTSNIIVVGSLNINTVDSNHTNMSTLEATSIFDGAFDDRDLGAKADTNNLDSSIVRRINHKDFHNCLFACFLSQMEPKKVNRALKDPSWIEAIQEELLRFKFQDIWTLVDLPYGKRAIGSK